MLLLNASVDCFGVIEKLVVGSILLQAGPGSTLLDALKFRLNLSLKSRAVVVVRDV